MIHSELLYQYRCRKKNFMKKQSLRLACLLALLVSVQSYGNTVIPLWDQSIPGNVSNEPETIDSHTEGDNRRFHHVSKPTLTLYPVYDTEPHPFIIICPGGGYRFLSFDKEGIEIAEWFNKLGISAGILKYRTPNNRAGALHDANRALEWTRNNATELNIDPARIGMIGFSAGAHLTAMAAQKKPKQNFSMMIYPAYLYQPNSFKLVKNITVNADTPPAFIAQAQDDKRHYRSALAYALALDEAGVSTELHLHAQGGHGYGLRDLGRPAHQWTALCEAWLRDQNIISPSDER